MVRIPGSHAPNIKNRSSKHLMMFTKQKPIVRCVSNEQLRAWNNGSSEVSKEIQRRLNKASKKD